MFASSLSVKNNAIWGKSIVFGKKNNAKSNLVSDVDRVTSWHKSAHHPNKMSQKCHFAGP